MRGRCSFTVLVSVSPDFSAFVPPPNLLLDSNNSIGGEYPMTATSGMENAVGSGKVSTKEDRLHRGRKVTSAFLMQGWGQFFNQVILIILLLCFHHGSGN